jgi:hypothetical protein
LSSRPQFTADGIFCCEKLGNSIIGTFQIKKNPIAQASITAKPFFLHMGFKIISEQQVERRGETFVNYAMEKFLIQTKSSKDAGDQIN